MPELPQVGRARSLDHAVILVVDDNEANVALLVKLLEVAGAERVTGLTDSRQTVERVRKLRPDLVLLDLHMPHLDGVAVLYELRDVIEPDEFLPVVVLTADATLGAKERALAAGATDFLTKPFERTEVLLRVTNLLETRALHQRLRQHNAALEESLREQAEQERRIALEHHERVQRIRHALDGDELTMVFQPIVDLSDGRVVGAEALARFSGPPSRPPNEWFAEATSVGLGAELELLALRTAIAQLSHLPADAYLSLNISPVVALRPDFADVLALGPPERLVVEITEHELVSEYDALLGSLAPVRALGVRLAVDDTGAGYASLQHILRLQPDLIKLDLELTRGVAGDPARKALAAALVTFAGDIGAAIAAEGIETRDDLDALRRLGVGCGQGYYLARPGPLPFAEPRFATAVR